MARASKILTKGVLILILTASIGMSSGCDDDDYGMYYSRTHYPGAHAYPMGRVHHVQSVQPARYMHRAPRAVPDPRAYHVARVHNAYGVRAAKYVYPAGGGTVCQVKTYSSPTKSGYSRICKGPTHRSSEKQITVNNANVRGSSYTYSAINAGPGHRSTVQHSSMRRVTNGSVVQRSGSRRIVSHWHR